MLPPLSCPLQAWSGGGRARGSCSSPSAPPQPLQGGRTWPPGLSRHFGMQGEILSLPRKKIKLFTGSSIRYTNLERESIFCIQPGGCSVPRL